METNKSAQREAGALEQCPACAHSVSATAATCPGCGHQLRTTGADLTNAGHLVAVLAVLVLVGAIAFLHYQGALPF